MIMAFGMMLIGIGFILSVSDWFVPLQPNTVAIIFAFRLMGVGLGFIGMFVVGVRSHQTGAGLWMDIPAKDRVICVHSGISGKRLDPNAKFIVAKDIGLGILASRKKVFKDTGGGFRICGHDVRRTHEKLGADIPEWLGQYLHQIKTKYGITNTQEFKELYEQLRRIDTRLPVPMQLDRIKLLEPVLQDEEKKQVLYNMKHNDLRNMSELLFDGETIHMEDVEKFIKLASPNELDTWIKQEMNINTMENRTYKDPGVNINWGNIIPSISILLVAGSVAFIMIMGYIK